MYVTELDSFVKKFYQLWNNGLTAHLDLDTHAGNAWVGLRVQLGHVPGPPHQVHPFPQQVQRKGESPSRMRRRARRAEAHQTKIVETTNGKMIEDAENDNKAEKASEALEEAVEPVESVEVGNEEVEKALDKEKVGITTNDEHDDTAEEHQVVNEIDGDCDVYTFTYWDNFKVSQAQEAINFIEENLKKNFLKNRVRDLDQVFKICGVENADENEILVKVKLKKNNWPVELSARNTQTVYNPEDPVSVSIQKIQR
jgi:hypothetical protein